MKAFIVAALLALSSFGAQAKELGDGRFSKAPPEVSRYEIVDDGGGSVDEFKEALRMIKTQKMGVKIDGYCASACTMLLNKEYGIDVCVTPSAKLMIHKPFLVQYSVTGYKIIKTLPSILKSEQIYQKDFYQQWPQWLKTEVDRGGGAPTVYTGKQPSDMLTVGFDTLKKNMTVCF